MLQLSGSSNPVNLTVPMQFTCLRVPFFTTFASWGTNFSPLLRTRSPDLLCPTNSRAASTQEQSHWFVSLTIKYL